MAQDTKVEPLELTSRRHPHAIASHVITAILMLLYFTNVIPDNRLTGSTNPLIGYVWIGFIFVGAVLALVGIFLPKTQIVKALRLESLGCTLVSFMFFVYMASLILFGFAAVAFSLSGIIAIGGALRAWQALDERGKVKLSLAHPVRADEKPLGKVKGD